MSQNKKQMVINGNQNTPSPASEAGTREAATSHHKGKFN